MRRLLIFAAILAAFALDVMIFPGLGLRRIAPDALIALFVSLSVLTGLVPSVPLAVAVGIILDIGFNAFIGMSAIPLFLASLAGSVFYSRFYADNVIVPALTASVAVMFKELFLLLVMLFSGGRTDGFFVLFALRMLPTALLSGALCAVFHLILKKTLPSSSLRLDIDYLRQ